MELFGDDLTERLKTVKESKRAEQQLTSQKRKQIDNRQSSSMSSAHFLFQHRGDQFLGWPQRKIHQQQAKNPGRKPVKQM